ncbi:MAG: hypothetical protein ACJAR8_001464 [Bacteroidia bacterium]|jgi:hypothetical protein
MNVFQMALWRKEPDGDAGLAEYNGYDGKNGSSDIDVPPLEIIIRYKEPSDLEAN